MTTQDLTSTGTPSFNDVVLNGNSVADDLNTLRRGSTVYGARYDQVNDVWQRGVVVAGMFIPCEVDTFPIHDQIRRGLLTTAGAFTPLHPDNSERFAVDEIIGNDLVTNGGFDTDTDWTKVNSTIVGGVGNIVSSDGYINSSLIQYILTNNKFYTITVSVTAITGSIDIRINSGTVILQITTPGTYTITGYNINGASLLICRSYAVSNTNAVIDNVSVYEIKTPVLDGTDGQVVVQYPRHHALNYSSGNYRYSFVSWEPFTFQGVSSYVPAPFSGGKDYAYLGAFLGTALTDSLTAEVGSVVKDTSAYVTNPYPNPFTNRTRAQFRTQQQAGFFQYPWMHYEMLWTLWLTEYANWNTQAVLPGYTEAAAWDYAYAKKAGRTLSLGNASGSMVVDYDGDDSELVGSDLVVDGGFDDPAYWTASSDWTVANSKATSTGEMSNSVYRAGTTVGKFYICSFDIVEYTSGAAKFVCGNTTFGNSHSSIGTYTEILQASGVEIFGVKSIDFVGSIDNVSVKEVPLAEGEYIANSYRGVEHFFGNCWQFLDGINIDNRVGDCHVYVNNDPATFADDTSTGYIDTGHAPGFGDVDGYIKEMAWLGEPLTFYPADITGGSSSTFVGDYNYNAISSWRVVLMGGNVNYKTTSGLACFLVVNQSSSKTTTITTRPAA